MSGVGAFVVGAAVGAAAVAHHKNKQKHKHHHHTEVHRTVVFDNQPVPNQVVYVAPPPPSHYHQHHPAPKPKKGQKHPPHLPLPPHQHAVVTTYYHNTPAPPPMGPGAPVGFAYNHPAPPQATYNAAHPPPYSPHPPSPHAQPFTLPTTPAPIPASYPPHSQGYPPAQPYPTTPGYPPAVQSPGYPPAAPFQAPVYAPLNSPSQSSGYPSNPYPGGYPPAPYPPVGQVQAQVTVQLSSAPGTNQASAAAYNNTPNNPYRRYFFIMSSETRWALQTNSMSGSKLVMQPKQQAADGTTGCQLWYCDNDGIIRSRFGDHGIESRDGGRWLCVAPYTGDARQQWVLRDGRILANRMNPGDCVCLEDGLMGTAVNADVIVARYQGKPNHHWNFEYI